MRSFRISAINSGERQNLDMSRKKVDINAEKLIEAAKKSQSIYALLINLGYSKNGYSAKQKDNIRQELIKFGFTKKDYPHFFIGYQDNTKSRPTVKRDFIKSLKPEEIKCAECHIGEWWNGKKLVLHLDHKNGIKNDNNHHNLRLLCPNCHSQTDTYSRPHKVRK